MSKYYGVIFDKNEETKKVKLENFLNFIPSWIAALEKRIESNESPDYAVGSKRTIADIALAVIAFDIINNDQSPLHADLSSLAKKEEHPVFTKYLTKLHEEFKEYLTTRPSPRPY